MYWYVHGYGFMATTQQKNTPDRVTAPNYLHHGGCIATCSPPYLDNIKQQLGLHLAG